MARCPAGSRSETTPTRRAGRIDQRGPAEARMVRGDEDRALEQVLPVGDGTVPRSSRGAMAPLATPPGPTPTIATGIARPRAARTGPADAAEVCGRPPRPAG